MILDEFTVENARAAFGEALCIQCHHGLHHPLENRDVAADLHQIVGRGDRRRAHRQHLDGVLRRREAFQSALAQRIEDDDRHAPLRGLAQRRQHPRVIGPGIMADAKDRVAMIEVFQRHRSLADAD